ncbi:MAG: hypothetical protein K8L97_10370 [Anaerolineae bacterium]|nr:hypothetical protein [Anaerolineae bacterium]
MAPNLDAMVRDAVSAYRAGRKDEARTMLLRAVEIDQYHEQAWLWLSAVVESVDEQRTCLENVITINPNNERAKQGLQVLIQKASVPAPKPVSAAQEDDLLASTHFGAPAAPSNPFGVSDEEEELPDNIWDGPVTASSSASSNHKVNEPSPEEYDNWVSNLNLGGTPSVVPGRGMDAAEEFMSSQPYDEEEEVGSDDAFNLRDMLGTDLDMVDIHDDEDDVFGPLSNTPPPAAPKREIASRSQPPPNAKVTSPSGKRSPGVGLDDGDEEDDDLSFIEDDDDDFFDDGELDKLDASEFFQYIPKEITATRMPGTRERYPALVLLGLIVFLGLNIGAVALFIQRMTTG